MKDLEVIIAKYYFPNELFAGQVKEITNMLIRKFAKHFPRYEAVDKAYKILEKYYLNA